jgi:Platelet-activating factor acetylhydrolase, isoform II
MCCLIWIMRVSSTYVAISLLLIFCPYQSLAQQISVLPMPSGSYAIGRQSFHLTDVTRADPFSPAPAHHRDMMIHIWYPAQPKTGAELSPYLPEARKLDRDATARQALRQEFEGSWPSIVSGSVQSHVISDASAMHGTFPVVFFSHGLMSVTFSYTAQIEDLVSHGYVVVAIEHPNASAAILFPDGHIRPFRHLPLSPTQDPLEALIASATEEVQIGAEDVRFVFNTLAQEQILLVKVMDLKRGAAVGHSYGGTLTARACQLDARIKACISEEGEVNPVGAFLDYPDKLPFTQPFLLIEADRPPPLDEELNRMKESRAQWKAYLTHKELQLHACKVGSYHIVLSRPGMLHGSFSDELVLKRHRIRQASLPQSTI